MPKIEHIIHVPIFDFNLIVCTGTITDFIAICRKNRIFLKQRDYEGATGILSFDTPKINGKNRIRMIMYIDISEKAIRNTINHECNHAAFYYLNYIFDDITGGDQQEIEAYLHAFLFDEVEKLIKKITGKRYLK